MMRDDVNFNFKYIFLLVETKIFLQQMMVCPMTRR